MRLNVHKSQQREENACDKCNGTGEIRGGFLASSSQCDACGGSGIIIRSVKFICMYKAEWDPTETSIIEQYGLNKYSVVGGCEILGQNKSTSQMLLLLNGEPQEYPYIEFAYQARHDIEQWCREFVGKLNSMACFNDTEVIDMD